MLNQVMKLLDQDNVLCHIVPLWPGVAGFVYRSRKRYHIFISESLSPQGQRRIALHEMHHILYDAPTTTYIIGLDMQREKFEVDADAFALRLICYLAG